MRKFIARNFQREVEWYVGAQQRRSLWNLILLPLGLVAVGVTWYGLFRVVWAFHLLFYPQHDLHDFWGRGIGFSSFLPSFLMVFAIAPGALCAGLAHYQFHSKSVKIDDLRTGRHTRYAMTDTKYGGNSKKTDCARNLFWFFIARWRRLSEARTET